MIDTIYLTKQVVTYLMVLIPSVILIVDLFIGHKIGVEATITGIVREWSYNSSWPEAIYLFGAIALYLHLFRKWLN